MAAVGHTQCAGSNPAINSGNPAANTVPSHGEFTWRIPCALEFDCWQEVTGPDIPA